MIDDEDVGHFIFQMVARNIPDVETSVYHNAKTVIDMISENNFRSDLLLLDINMPFMDGWDFLDALEPLDVSLPIYIVSSSTSPRDLEKSKKYKRVKGFLSKPITYTDLNTMVVTTRNESPE